MLDVLLSGERLSRAAFNDSASKQHYSFGYATRFAMQRKPIQTEYNYEVAQNIAGPADRQQLLEEERGVRKPAFNSTSSRIEQLFVSPAPPPDAYRPQLIRKSRSCSFGIGRDVRLSDGQFQQLLETIFWQRDNWSWTI